MSEVETDQSNGQVVPDLPDDDDPADLILLTEASRRFHIRRDTLLYRSSNNGSPRIYKRLGRSYVSEAEMEKQPPVDEQKSARGYKRPDVAARNKLKRKYTKRGTTPNVVSPRTEEEQNLERHICYAFGRVQAWLDIYATGIGIAPSVFTERVGQLLQGPQGGSTLGASAKLSGV
jgi:hypothetical protein